MEIFKANKITEFRSDSAKSRAVAEPIHRYSRNQN